MVHFLETITTLTAHTYLCVAWQHATPFPFTEQKYLSILCLKCQVLNMNFYGAVVLLPKAESLPH